MKSILLPFAGLALAAGAASAQTVAPPPLPIGAQQVRPEAGLNQEERKRHVRAHHHKMHHKKDYTREDADETRPGDGRENPFGRLDRKDIDGRNDRSGGSK